ncbi:YadA-like family protein [Acidaminococcus sp.]|uniref:YadA-like family protein n=1 Tax=Acidaminococcus sp. TaxID=1872103 RepID=UPI003D7CE013
MDLGNGASAAYDENSNLTIGKDVQAKGSDNAGRNNVTIGNGADTLRKDGDTEGQPLDGSNTQLVDGEGTAHTLTRSTSASNATVLGNNSRAEGDSSTAIGATAKVAAPKTTYYADADGNKTTNLSDAAWYKDSQGKPTRVPQVFRDKDDNKTTTPQYSYTKEDGTTGVTDDVSKADKVGDQPKYSYRKSDNIGSLYTVELYQDVSNSIAAGSHVTAEGKNAVAVGYETNAVESAVGIGDSAQATGKASIAIGKGITASAEQATAVGAGTTSATGNQSTAVGFNVSAKDTGSSAFGSNVTAENSSYASGMTGTTADYGSVAVGSNVHSTSGSYASGMTGTTAEGGSIAVGSNVHSTNGSYASGMTGTTAEGGSIAVGSNVHSTNSSYASGISGTQANSSSVAVGSAVMAENSSYASGMNGTNANYGSVAMGSKVHSTNGSFAAGINSSEDDTTTAEGGSIAVGSNVHSTSGSYASGMTGTTANNGSYAAGMNGTKADSSSVAVGSGVTATNGSYASGMDGTTANSGSVAVGANVQADNSSFAAGFNSSAGTNGISRNGTNIAVGGNTSANNGSTALGLNATADYCSLAIGLKGSSNDSASASNYSMAMGNAAYASWNSTAIGNSARAQNYAVALGGNTSAYVYNSVALGANSTANVASGQAGFDPSTGSNSTDTNTAWKSTLGAVSVGTVDRNGKATATRQINGLAAGTVDTDAVNVAQLKAVAAVAGVHTAVTVNDKSNPTSAAAGEGDYGDYAGGETDNLRIAAMKSADGQLTYNIKLNDQLSIGRKGEDGIDGSIGVTGKDGSSVVINGKDGSIGLTGKDGADGLTIRGATGAPGAAGTDGMTRIIYKDSGNVDHTVATLDDGLKFKGDSGETVTRKLNTQLKVTGGQDDEEKLTALEDKNIGVVSRGDQLEIRLSKDLKGLNTVAAGKNSVFGRQTVTNTGGGEETGDYVTGLDNRTWNNESYVSGRAATEDQLQQVVSNLTGPSASGGFGLSANGGEVKKALGKTIAINGDGTYGADGKETKAGNIRTSVEGEAVKVSLNKDLHIDSATMEKTNPDGSTVTNKTTAEGSEMTRTDAGGKKTASTVTGAGSLTITNGDVTTTIDKDGVNTNKVKVGDNTTIDNGSATIGGVTINGNGETDGDSEHTSTITGLSNKKFDTTHLDQYEDSGRAATEAQLKEVYDKASQHTTVTVNGKPSAEGNLKMEETKNGDGSMNYALSLNNDITLGDEKTDGKLTVKSKDETKFVTANGEDGTLTLKDGDKEASIKAADAAKGVDDTTDISRVSVGGSTVATLDDGLKFAGDSGDPLKQKLNSTTNIKGGAAGALTDGNIGVISDGRDTLTVKLAKDIKGLDSVEATTVNATTVNASTVSIAGDNTHSAITIRQGDINMGGNTISGAAPGKVSADSTEVVNGSQLYARDQAIGKLGSSVNRLDNKINRAGAGAAALAALHPQDFDPDDKWDFAAGYGNYHGASAAAIGAFYRPTEDVMFSVGGSMGGGENMVNAGVTFKLGQHNHVSNSRVAMAKEIRDLKATVGQLTQMVNMLTGNAGGKTVPLQKGDTLFPDVPKNHWAYDYVTRLARAGMLEGYPDGEFKGDRMMTRYEFATVIYRAIMAGAAGNPKLNQDGTLDKLVDEFGDELQYIRIAVVERDKNGKPTIERVRTVADDARHHHKKENTAQAGSQKA